MSKHCRALRAAVLRRSLRRPRTFAWAARSHCGELCEVKSQVLPLTLNQHAWAWKHPCLRSQAPRRGPPAWQMRWAAPLKDLPLCKCRWCGPQGLALKKLPTCQRLAQPCPIRPAAARKRCAVQTSHSDCCLQAPTPTLTAPRRGLRSACCTALALTLERAACGCPIAQPKPNLASLLRGIQQTAEAGQRRGKSSSNRIPSRVCGCVQSWRAWR